MECLWNIYLYILTPLICEPFLKKLNNAPFLIVFYFPDATDTTNTEKEIDNEESNIFTGKKSIYFYYYCIFLNMF